MWASEPVVSELLARLAAQKIMTVPSGTFRGWLGKLRQLVNTTKYN